MKPKSQALVTLLAELRDHPAFPDLLAHIEAPHLPVYRPKRSGDVELAQATWIYQSGRVANHQAWFQFLTGKDIPHDPLDRVDDNSSAEKE